MGTQRIKICKCNFKFPKPLRQEDNGGMSYVRFDFTSDIFLLEFFCAFCRGVITNDGKYIVEVIRYHASQRWSEMNDIHRDMIKELEFGYGLFARQYKRLLTLTV